MSGSKNQSEKPGNGEQPETETEQPTISRKKAAASVKRTVYERKKKGEETVLVEKQVAVKENEVFDFRVRDNEVTVITADGQKLKGTI